MFLNNLSIWFWYIVFVFWEGFKYSTPFCYEINSLHIRTYDFATFSVPVNASLKTLPFVEI